MLSYTLKQAIDALTADELRQVSAYVEQRLLNELSPAQRVQMIEQAVAEIRAGLSADELEHLAQIMNEEQIETFNPADWRE